MYSTRPAMVVHKLQQAPTLPGNPTSQAAELQHSNHELVLLGKISKPSNDVCLLGKSTSPATMTISKLNETCPTSEVQPGKFHKSRQQCHKHCWAKSASPATMAMTTNKQQQKLTRMTSYQQHWLPLASLGKSTSPATTTKTHKSSNHTMNNPKQMQPSSGEKLQVQERVQPRSSLWQGCLQQGNRLQDPGSSMVAGPAKLSHTFLTLHIHTQQSTSGSCWRNPVGAAHLPASRGEEGARNWSWFGSQCWHWEGGPGEGPKRKEKAQWG